MKPANHRAWGIAATLVVAAAVAYGFWIVGTPEERRTERIDERRVEDLQAIVAEIQELVYEPDDKVLKRALFEDLAALRDAARTRRLRIDDPRTGVRYRYRVLDAWRYELCATFDAPRAASWKVFWNHDAGPRCWTIDVRDPP